MFIVYVLRNEDGKIYKEVTNDLKRRLSEHRSEQTKSTRNFSNFEVIYTEAFANFKSARSRELYLKSAAGRRFLKKKGN